MSWSLIWNDVVENGWPSISFAGPTTGVWYNSNQNVSWTVVDNVSGGPATGIAGFTQGWDSIPTDSTSQGVDARASSVYDSFYIGPEYPNGTSGCLALASGQPCSGGVSQGCHTVHVEGWNNMGHTSGDATYGPLCYDTVAPTVGISDAPVANSNGWNNSTVNVTLSPADPGGSGASGIYRTYYAVNTGPCNPSNTSGCTVYSAPVAITTQGYNYIWYFTEDYAGNFSTGSGGAYEWVYIDETAPVTTAALGGTLNGSVYNSAVTVTLGATDNLSGVQFTYYQLDGGAVTAYSSPLNVTALGAHTVKYHSVDYAGNTEATKTVTFTISQAAQTITFADPSPQTYGTPLTLTATASSGLAVSFASTTPTICTVSGNLATFLSTGTCTIKATQTGSTYIAAATPVSQSFAVNKEAQTITFAAIPATTLLTGSITIAPTASSALPVTVTSATPTICTVSGTTVHLLAVGNCGLVANQVGNIDFLAATAVGRNFQVTLATQTITFPATPATTLLTGSVAMTATASSGLPVSYTSATPTVCTVSGSTVSLLAVGNCGIVANQAGNGDYYAAPAVGHNFQVTLATQTITFPAIPTHTFGTPVALSATASSGLAVSFASLTPTICTVSGTTATLLSSGTCTIKATQAGNVDYAAAAAVAQSFTVTHEAQTITFPAIPATTLVTGSVTLTATASSGLPVTYTSATPTICTVSGSTVHLVALGNCGIVANQAGNSDFAAATAVGHNFTVTLATQTITFPAIPATPLVTGTVSLTATASSGLAVSYTSATPTVCSVSGSTVSLLAIGNCGIVAHQAGNGDYYAAPAAGQSFHVTPAAQTITFPTIPTKAFGAPVALSATASSGLAVSFASTTPTVCTVSGTTATLVATGTCTINATQAGNVDYSAATPVSQSFTVSKGTQTITFPTIPSTTLVTGSVTLTATASSGLPVSYTSATPTICTVSGSAVTLVAVGNCGIVANQAGNSNYGAATAVGRNFAVTLATQTITFPTVPATPLGTGTVALTATASSGLAVSYTSTTPTVCTVSGSTVTLVATGTCGIVANQAGNFEYYAAPAVGRGFTVTAH
jgi:hypothetical protein